MSRNTTMKRRLPNRVNSHFSLIFMKVFSDKTETISFSLKGTGVYSVSLASNSDMGIKDLGWSQFSYLNIVLHVSHCLKLCPHFSSETIGLHWELHRIALKWMTKTLLLESFCKLFSNARWELGRQRTKRLGQLVIWSCSQDFYPLLTTLDC